MGGERQVRWGDNRSEPKQLVSTERNDRSELHGGKFKREEGNEELGPLQRDRGKALTDQKLKSRGEGVLKKVLQSARNRKAEMRHDVIQNETMESGLPRSNQFLHKESVRNGPTSRQGEGGAPT